MTKIAGRTAVVTGAGSGIGRGIALALAGEGASVAIADIIAENAEKVAEEIRQAGGTAIGVRCDVIDRDSIAAMKAQVTAELGAVSLMFANAGATSFERLADMAEQDVDWILHANLIGVTNCLMAFYPDMVRAGDGHVFATSSTAGLLPSWVPYHAPYSGAKLGIVGLMLNLGIEAAEHGVGCTVFCPGGGGERDEGQQCPLPPRTLRRAAGGRGEDSRRLLPARQPPFPPRRGSRTHGRTGSAREPADADQRRIDAQDIPRDLCEAGRRGIRLRGPVRRGGLGHGARCAFWCYDCPMPGEAAYLAVAAVMVIVIWGGLRTVRGYWHMIKTDQSADQVERDRRNAIRQDKRP